MNCTDNADAAGLRTTPGIAFTWGISKSGAGKSRKKKKVVCGKEYSG